MRKSMKFLYFLVVGAMLLTACGVTPAATQAPAAAATQAPVANGQLVGEIQIGNIAPMTGSLSSYGQSHTNAVEMAADQINAQGGLLGKKVVINTQDDTGDPTVGVNAAKVLISDGVAAIIGPIPSSIGNAVAPVVQDAKMPTVVTGTSPSITVGRSYVFRSCWTDDFQGAVMAKFAYNELGKKSAAVLYDLGNDYAKSVSQVFITTFKGLGGTITDVETHPSDATDFSAQLTKIKATNPEVFFFPDFYSAASLIGRQVKATGLQAVLLGADGWDSPDLDRVSLDGAYYTGHFSLESTRPQTQAFIKAYQTKYGKDPDLLAIMGYDAAQIVFDSIKRAGSNDHTAIQTAMAATKDLAAAQGNINFDQNDDPTTLPAVILQIANGKDNYKETFQP